jgi:hypothetical protein
VLSSTQVQSRLWHLEQMKVFFVCLGFGFAGTKKEKAPNVEKRKETLQKESSKDRKS